MAKITTNYPYLLDSQPYHQVVQQRQDGKIILKSASYDVNHYRRPHWSIDLYSKRASPTIATGKE